MAEPAAGVHFVVFNPTSDDFRRNRRAMDGVMPDGTRLQFETGTTERVQLDPTTTHRQNFLVPPRAHRSFPLSELLTRVSRPRVPPEPRKHDTSFFVGRRHTRDACAGSRFNLGRGRT